MQPRPSRHPALTRVELARTDHTHGCTALAHGHVHSCSATPVGSGSPLHAQPLAHPTPCTLSRVLARPHALTSPAKAQGTGSVSLAAPTLGGFGEPRAQRGVVAGVEAWRWVTMSLGCEAAWHARQELLTLFSSRGTLPSQGLPASSEETLAGREGGGGGQGRGWRGGKGASGS